MTSWEDKHALLVGATQGLGLAMVKCLARRGALLTLVARSEDRLRDAKGLAIQEGARAVRIVPADACNGQELEVRLRENLVDGPAIDVAINFVGQSDRGYLMHLNETNLLESYRVNVVSAWNVARVSLPLMNNSGGTIVFVGSLASHLAPAGMGCYALSKFPLVALRQQLTLEHASSKVHYMLVCPGPIHRDDQERYRQLVQSRDLPESVAKPGGGAKLSALDPSWVCGRILRGVERGEREIIMPWKAKVAVVISRISPRLGDWVLKSSMRT